MAISVAVMLTVAPLVATTTLVCWNPSRWGGSFNPVVILGMSIFGIFTFPLWPTYIPAIVLTPFAMQWLSRCRVFARTPMPLMFAVALPLGAAAGFGIMAPLLARIDAGDPDLWMNWAAAGCMAGAVTFPGLVAVHKYILKYSRAKAEQSPPPYRRPAVRFTVR